MSIQSAISNRNRRPWKTAGMLSILSILMCALALRASAGVTGTTTSPPVHTFYVATDGNDSNPGTLSLPFATVPHCLAQGAGTTCYVRAGSYAPANIPDCDCGIEFPYANETLSYYPPDGIDSADFTGGSTEADNGLVSIVSIGNSTNATINGLSFHNFQYSGIGSGGGTFNPTVENSLIYNGYYVPGSAANPGGISCYGCANANFNHNVIHDIAAWGIVFGNVNGNISGLSWTYNVIYNTCTGLEDCGAIYIQDNSATATNMTVSFNYIEDGNTFAGLGSGYGQALYLDDCTSNVTLEGNVVTGRNGSNTTMIHGGNNDHYIRNLIDLTSYAQNIMAFQTSGGSGCSAGTMSGNEVESNVIIGQGGGGGYTKLSGSPLNSPTIENNDYYNYGGSAISSEGAYNDSNPVKQNPRLSACYVVASDSPVLASPVSFRKLPIHWGPPGYVIPNNASAPSYLPSCIYWDLGRSKGGYE
jgi:hypothetical protein